MTTLGGCSNVLLRVLASLAFLASPFTVPATEPAASEVAAAGPASGMLRIALLQMEAAGNDQDANRAKADAFCRRAAANGADLALMPEMWNIGYTGFSNPDPEERKRWQAQAVKRNGAFVDHFRNLARELNLAIAVTYLEEWPGAPRNSITLIDRHGRDRFTYAKIHTCDFAAFEASTTPGEDVFVTALDTRLGPVKVGAMICYDREFPETARMLMLKEAELVIVPNACLLDDVRLAQFGTRAVENALVMAMANYPDPTCGGRSVAYMVDGTQLAEAGKGEELLLVDVPLASVRDFRKRGLWGHAFRRPHRYGALVEQRDIEVFHRTNAFGDPFVAEER
jgi:predicted amidohydrolase